MKPHSKEERLIGVLSSLLFATIILFFLGDISRKWAIALNLDFTRYTAVSKSIVIVLYLTTLLYFFKVFYKIPFTKTLINYSSILIFTYLISQLIINNHDSFYQRLTGNFIYFGRYMIWFLSLIVFFPLLTIKGSTTKHFKTFKMIFFANVVVIIVALVFELSLFKTYHMNSERFGYMGFYNTSNQASYYFILFLLYYYYLSFINQESRLKLVFFLVLVASLFVGTKKIYFFLILLCIFHGYKFCWYKKLKSYLYFGAIFLIMFLFKNEVLGFLSKKFDVLVEVYSEEGFLTAFFSFRNELLIQSYQFVISEWELLNYFIGGAKFYSIRPEFEVVDIYLIFGFFGCYVFYWIFKKLYRYSAGNKFYLFIIVCLSITSFFAAGFVSDANIPLMFILVSASFINMPQNQLYLS